MAIDIRSMKDLTFKKYCLTFLLVKENKRQEGLSFAMPWRVRGALSDSRTGGASLGSPLAISNVRAFDLQIHFFIALFGEHWNFFRPSFKHAAWKCSCAPFMCKCEGKEFCARRHASHLHRRHFILAWCHSLWDRQAGTEAAQNSKLTLRACKDRAWHYRHRWQKLKTEPCFLLRKSSFLNVILFRAFQIYWTKPGLL